MISSKKIQKAYNDLYEAVRKYVWPFQTVEQIADLEIASYQAFQDLKGLKDKYNKLYSSCQSQIGEDEDLKKAFDDYKEVIDSDNTVFVKLHQVRETVNV